MSSPATSIDDKVRREIIRSFRWKRRAWKFAEFFGITTWAGMTGYPILYDYLNDSEGPFQRYAALSAMAGLTGILVTSMLGTIFSHPRHYLSPTFIGKSLSVGVGDNEKEDPKAVESLYETILAKTKNPLDRLRVTAARDLRLGKANDALRTYLDLLNILNSVSYRPRLSERFTQWLFDLRIRNEKAHHRTRTNIEFGFAHLISGMKGLGEYRLRRACKLDTPLRIEANCLYGYYCHDLVRRSKTKNCKRLPGQEKKQWKKTVDLILVNEEINNKFRRLGTSQNEVLEIGGQGLLHDTFILKKSRESIASLQKEGQITEFLYNAFGQTDHIVQPLAFVEKDGNAYLVLRRIPGKPLAGNKSLDTWDRSIDFTAEFHDRLRQRDTQEKFPFNDKVDSYRALRAYAKRVAKNENEQEKIVVAMRFLADYLSQKRQQIIHGDFHPENIFVNDSGFTVLDPERMIYGDVKSDLVDLIESRLVPEKFEEPDRERWRRRYHDAEKKREGYDEWRLDYAYAGVARLLKTIGTLTARSYGFTPEESSKIKKDYTNRARTQLKVIAQLDEAKKEEVKVLEDMLEAA